MFDCLIFCVLHRFAFSPTYDHHRLNALFVMNIYIRKMRMFVRNFYFFILLFCINPLIKCFVFFRVTYDVSAEQFRVIFVLNKKI